MVAISRKLTFCKQEVPVLKQGQNFSSIRYLEPLAKVLYLNYTIAACNPLYPNVVKLEDGSFQQYGETLRKFDQEICQWPMNKDLNSSDQNLHRSFLHIKFKKSQIARTIRHNSKGIISREAFRDLDGKYNHDNFVPWNNQFQQQIFLAKEITIFRNLKN